MKILFLTPHPEEGASTRYRVKQFFPYFNHNGIECVFHPFFLSDCYSILYKKGRTLRKGLNLLKGIFHRTIDLVNSSDTDIVFVHLEASPLGLPIFEKIFTLLNKPIIYDLDDAIYIKEVSPANWLAYFLKSSSKIPKIITMSNYIVVCNEYLETYARRFNQRIKMIPTSVDTNKFTVKDYNMRNEVMVIGWIGSHTTAHYLMLLTEVFKRLSKRHKFVLKIIGADKKNYFPGIDVIYSDWSLEKDVYEFQSLDIGIYPLPDNEWVKGKTGFKTVQYMSVGVPCIVSRVGRNMTIVEDGVNGFLASLEDEWVEKLSLLIENPELRKRMGMAGRKTVEERYSVKANASKYLQIFKKVYEERYEKSQIND